MLRKLLVLVLLFVSLALGVALGERFNTDGRWLRTDLRAFDPIDASQPGGEITALYTRRYGFDCQVRLDLLELVPGQTYAFSIQLGERQVTAVVNGESWPGVSVAADDLADTVTITLDDCSPRPDDPLMVTSLPDSASSYIADQVGPLPFDAQPPAGQGYYMLSFSDAFLPSSTPIQALRRWDGAHTGPRGERHGLRYLLANAEKYQIPLTLPGLVTPENLSALDALGGLAQVQRMAQTGMLVLPLDDDVSYARNLSAAESFDITPTALCAETSTLLPACRYQFDSSPASASELSDNGLSTEARLTLHQAVLSAETDVIWLGGRFSQTTWGTPDYLAPAFAYLAARPYLVPVTARTLGDISPVGAVASAMKLPAALQDLPANPLANSALDAFFVTQGKTTPDVLRESYALLPVLLAQAARWADAPQEMQVFDSQTYTLASENVLAVFGLDGRLVFLFVRDQKGNVHQLVGPTAQFFIGLSDSSQWNPAAGLGADPVPGNGAFVLSAMDSTKAPVFSDAGQALFDRRSYQFLPNGIRVKIDEAVNESLYLPLVVDPWRRFESGWVGRGVVASDEGGVRLGWRAGPMVRVTATGRLGGRVESSFDAFPFLLSAEDPNFGYPPGMYLPFGVHLLRFDGGALELEITLDL